MLSSINLDDKSYEDLMAEALANIHLYSAEWTNFNRSDPGITILQNLTAFNLLQQSTINTVSDEVRRKLLALAGYSAEKNRAATLFLQSPGNGGTLPPQYLLQVGGLAFETEEEVALADWGLRAVYAQQEENYQDLSYLLKAGTTAVDPFGSKPRAGCALCCVLAGTPPMGAPLHLWVHVLDNGGRNPFPTEGGPVFAKTRWQYYTGEGWADADAEDDTRGLLVSGAVTLTLNSGVPVPFTGAPVHGPTLRCLLEEARYDCPPRLQALAAGLFPVRQWQSRSQCYAFPGGEELTLINPLAALGNLFVYCQEKAGGPYRAYTPLTGSGVQGRFFVREEMDGGVKLSFDGPRFGFAPWRGQDAVRVLCYDDEMIHHRDLGLVYGYEGQEVSVDLVENILPEYFTILVQTPGAGGTADYSFVPPENKDSEGLCYRVDPCEGKLHILRAGSGVGCRLFLGDCRVTRGAEGNIRPGGRLEHSDSHGAVDRAFENPGPGRGGRTYETSEALRAHFTADLRQPYAAVLPTDYEDLTRSTPGLCIHKVKAISVPGKNLVRIAVKPKLEEPFPQLSNLYLHELIAWLEPRRMLTTRVEFLQPRYVPVDVRVMVYVKSYFSRADDEIKGVLRKLLDHANGPQNFGERVYFHTIHQSLLALPCVEAVENLCLLYPPEAGVTVEGSDLLMDGRSLCCPGKIQVQLRTRPAGRDGS